MQQLLPACILSWGSSTWLLYKLISFHRFKPHSRMTWKIQGQNKQIRLTEWKKSSLRGACQHSLLPFLTWQQFPLGSCRSPMHFPSNPHFPMELPQPIWFRTSAGTELLQLSICFPLASFFLPVHLSYFCLGETSLLLLSAFLLLSLFSSPCLPGDIRLTLTGEETQARDCPFPSTLRQLHLSANMLPPKGHSYSSRLSALLCFLFGCSRVSLTWNKLAAQPWKWQKTNPVESSP